MDQQLRQIGMDGVIVMEFEDGSTVRIPEGIAEIFIHWLKCMTSNGFSDVTITSEKKNHDVIVKIKAGSVIRASVPWHQIELMRKRLMEEIS